jgi:Holliday junction resolvase-like predicted endonuclease
MEKKQVRKDQAGKARIGAIGENLVVAKLMQQGWDAFNANCTIKNYKSIDIVCLNSELKESDELWWKPKTSLVQVKTSVQTNIPTGFTIEESLDKDYLEKMVKGPYVFVFAKQQEGGFNFRYFVLSRRQFIRLLHTSHVFYDKKHNGQEVKTAPAGLSVSWLEGKPEFSPRVPIDFGNPIKETCEDQWENIWME